MPGSGPWGQAQVNAQAQFDQSSQNFNYLHQQNAFVQQNQQFNDPRVVAEAWQHIEAARASEAAAREAAQQQAHAAQLEAQRLAGQAWQQAAEAANQAQVKAAQDKAAAEAQASVAIANAQFEVAEARRVASELLQKCEDVAKAAIDNKEKTYQTKECNQ